MMLESPSGQPASTTFADILPFDRVMDHGIRPVWEGAPSIAGPSYTVACGPGDSLMLHAAIYAAEPGSVIVVQTGNLERAVAGGNVCRVAQRRGIVGLVVDGLVRDVAELRAHGIAVYARGVVSAAGAKDFISPLNVAVYCGGVCVNPGDVVVADEDGIVVLPCSSAPALLADALAREAAEATESLDAWEDAHRSRIGQRLRDLGSQTPQIGTR